uniref:Capsid protein n=1 Tax=Dromedary picobirnavirus TaxID=1574421 RepID=A0A0A1EIS3_9VIRU|nr:capsid protein [Dromedary picobirnavirus]
MAKRNNYKGKQNESKGSKFYNKGGRNRNANREDKPARISDRTCNNSFNDPEWYNNNPDLLEAAARIPFAHVPGRAISIGDYADSEGVVRPATEYLPGVMAIEYVPTIGYSADVNSPASIAAREMYAKVRAKFSGTLVADAPDLMMYVLALDSVYGYISYLMRLYKTINAFTAHNVYYPDPMLHAMGITSDAAIMDLRVNKTKLWGLINTLIQNSRKFRCPGKYDLLNRHFWMNQRIYSDADSPKAQYYVFMPIHFYKFKEFSETGGGLEAFDFADELYQICSEEEYIPGSIVDYLYSTGDEMISRLANSEDAYTINGYFERAYEGESQFIIADLIEDDVVEIVYSPEVLMQIENSRTVVRDRFTPSDFDITQDPSNNAIIQVIKGNMNGSFNILLDYNGLNIHGGTPTPLGVAVATRLACTQDINYVSEEVGYELTYHCGTELVIDYRFFYFSDEGLQEEVMSTYYTLEGASDFIKALYHSSLMSSMDWHPIFVASLNMSAWVGKPEGHMMFGDLSNFTTIAPAQTLL